MKSDKQKLDIVSEIMKPRLEEALIRIKQNTERRQEAQDMNERLLANLSQKIDEDQRFVDTFASAGIIADEPVAVDSIEENLNESERAVIN